MMHTRVCTGEYWMSDENSTHFQFRLGGIGLEIEGDREFVEQMYRRVMRDIESVRKRVAARRAEEEAPPRPEADDSIRRRQILWVHRCTPMMHKIYMSAPAEVDESPLLRMFETTRLNVIFADRDSFEQILPGGGAGQTMWAELTEKGRQRIAEAAPE
jgi:hypothetical protein